MLIDSNQIIEAAQQGLEEKREKMIAEASRVLNQNHECYVAQWILQNPEVDFNDYQLEFVWRQDGFGYNVYMKKKGEE